MQYAFEETIQLCRDLAADILESKFKPDYIVGLARGGWVPARLLSNELGVKRLLSVGVGYEDDERRYLNAYSIPNGIPKGSRLLIVEDCVESGRSLDFSVEKFSGDHEVKTASLFITDRTNNAPNYYLRKLREVPIFAWDKDYDIENHSSRR